MPCAKMYWQKIGKVESALFFAEYVLDPAWCLPGLFPRFKAHYTNNHSVNEDTAVVSDESSNEM